MLMSGTQAFCGKGGYTNLLKILKKLIIMKEFNTGY